MASDEKRSSRKLVRREPASRDTVESPASRASERFVLRVVPFHDETSEPVRRERGGFLLLPTIHELPLVPGPDSTQ